MTNHTNRSNGADKVVRYLAVYASGRVSHRDAKNGRAPWETGAAWGRAGAHALPNEGPGEAMPTPTKVKDPRKVAAGKARAAQAKAAREAAAVKTKPPAPSPMQAAARTLSVVGAKKATAKTTRAKKGEAKGPSPGAMVVMAVRVTPAQKAKYDKLGAEWLRARIEAATVTPGKRK